MRRAPTPEPVKRAVIYRNMSAHAGRLVCEECGEELTEAAILSALLHIDHDPPVGLRARGANGDTIPPANDLRYLQVLCSPCHTKRTYSHRRFGRGDLTEIARLKRIERSTKQHEKVMLEKAGYTVIDETELRKAVKRQWPSQKIPSRPFPKRT